MSDEQEEEDVVNLRVLMGFGQAFFEYTALTFRWSYILGVSGPISRQI